jgi:hypothetical protein
MKKRNVNNRVLVPTLLMACLPSLQAAEAETPPSIKLDQAPPPTQAPSGLNLDQETLFSEAVAGLKQDQTPQATQPPTGLKQDPSSPPTQPQPGVKLDENPQRKKNQIGLNYWLGLNMAVDFKNLGGFPRQTNPGPATGGGIDRFYDDGQSRVDSSGNQGGSTWYWGYDSASQVSGQDALLLNSSASYEQTYKNDVDEKAAHGVELTYRHDLGRLFCGRWGLEGAFAYTGFSVDSDSTLTTSYTRLSDAYVLDGVIPPLTPYQGTAEGPGPVISDSPQRVLTVDTDGAIVAGKRELETDLFDFRLGPYWEVPLAKRVAASLSGGLAFAVLASEFNYHETVTIPAVGSISRSAHDSQSDVIFGAFLAGRLTYKLTEDLTINGGVQWQYLGDQDHKADGKKAVLDLDEAIFVTLGLGYSF